MNEEKKPVELSDKELSGVSGGSKVMPVIFAQGIQTLRENDKAANALGTVELKGRVIGREGRNDRTSDGE